MSVLDEEEQHRVYDPDGERPVTRPDLLAQERHAGDSAGFYRPGGGNPDKHGPNRGTGDEEDARETHFAKKKSGNMYRAEKEEEERNTRRNRMKARLGNSMGKKAKYAVAAGIAGSVVLILALAFLLLSIFGSLKVVHFATVLRSAGLARFTLQMQKQYDRTLFDAATLTDSSTGRASKELGDRSMLQKMLGINPQKRLAQLGEEGTLKFDFEGSKSWNKLTSKNTFKGVVVDGKPIYLDDLAKEKFNKPYKDLSKTQVKEINGVFRDRVRINLSDRLSLEGLMYRSSVYAGIRQLAGIRMLKWKWPQDKTDAGKTDAQVLEDDVKQAKEYTDGGDQAPDSGIKEIKDQAADQGKEAEDLSVKGKNISRLEAPSAKIAAGARKASVGALLATGACVVHDLNNSFKDAAKTTELRADRLGHDALTTGDQIKQGNTNAQLVGAEATRWGDADKSALYKQQTGTGGFSQADVTQLGAIPDVRGPANGFKTAIGLTDALFNQSNFLSVVPVIGDKAKNMECDIVLHPVTQYGIAGAELVSSVASAGLAEGFLQATKVAISGGFQLAGSVAVSDVLGRLIDKAVHTFAHLDYSGLDNNEKLYNESYVGVDSLGQYGTRQINFGKPITAGETRQLQNEAMTQVVAMNKQRPFMQRYFAIDNPNSLIGNVAAAVPTSANGVSTYAQHGLAFIGSLFSSPQLLLQHLGSIFLPHTMAATDQIATGANFGVDQWGWTDDENARLQTDAFSNAANTTYVEGNGVDAYNQLMDKYSPCYTYETPSEKPDKCTEQFLSTDEALHWRAFMAEICAASSLGGGIVGTVDTNDLIAHCTEAPTSSDSGPTGVADATIDMAHLYDPSDNIKCAPGTKDMGVMSGDNSGEHDGKKISIRLCEIPGFKCSCAQAMTNYSHGAIKSEGNVVVNSRVSGAWATLYQTAKSQGVTFQSNSAFRTHAYQVSLFVKNPDPARVAVPGHSNHQMGLALDLANTSYGFIDYGDKWHNWMKAHGKEYGFKQYPPESWHWSPTGN
jgi:D-alanyl-D-alanine carboxypeptidase